MSEKQLLQKVLSALQEKNAKIAAYEKEKTEPIAIVGLACKFPGGANSPSAFWDLLINEVDATGMVPGERWDLSNYKGIKVEDFVPYAALIENVDAFDASFFKISSREAKSMDPQHRLLLETSYEALEDAGSFNFSKKANTGVFVGITQSEYGTLLTSSSDVEEIDSFFSTGNLLNAAAGRISYALGFNGPCMAVDTACSSSLVSVHLACQSLRNQECDQALAGGVNLLLSPYGSIATTKSKMLAPDGKCKVFDESADGYVRGEGCGMIVLKKLSDAKKDGDHIHAVIRSSGVSQDGASSGLTVPNGPGQKKLIENVLNKAVLSPEDISYIEAHGTGTSLGDPIEFAALNNTYSKSHDSEKPLYVGAVKSNIGHLESAAGIAGLIKVILSLKHKQIPANLHFKQPSSHIEWKNSPLKVVDRLVSWESENNKRIAGVSAFGFSGTNAHVIVQETEVDTKSDNETKKSKLETNILCLSAKNIKGLIALASSYIYYLESKPNIQLESICYTANACRDHFAFRTGIVASSKEELQQKLKDFIQHNQNKSDQDFSQDNSKPRIAFLFPGQGVQYSQMCKSLFETEPIFRSTLLQCQELLTKYMEVPLLDIIHPKEKEDSRINETCYTQPAIFSVSYAMAKMWQSWGIQPKAVLGHSVGEYVAACIAGIFTLEDALRLITVRGKCLQSMPENGKMLAVLMEEQKVQKFVEEEFPELALAAVNGPRHVVISGNEILIDQAAKILSNRKIAHKLLKTNRAFHSPATLDVLKDFEKVANSINFQTRELAIISNVTGTLVTNEMSIPAYWVQHIHDTVQFQKGVHALAQENIDVFLEVGPGTTLTSMSRSIKPVKNILYLSTVSADQKEWKGIFRSISKLYERGGIFNWERFYENQYPQKVSLPTYPFQRKSYWFRQPPKLNHGKSVIESENNINKRKVNTPDITKIKSTLVDIVSGLLEENPSDISTKSPLLEMGADSIVLMDAGKKIEEAFGLEISIRQFFDELKDIDSLATYIDANVQPVEEKVPQSEATEIYGSNSPNIDYRSNDGIQNSNGVSRDGLDQLVAQQLELNAKLINMLSGNTQKTTGLTTINIVEESGTKYKPKKVKSSQTEIIDPLATFRNKKSEKAQNNELTLEERRNQGLTKSQQEHVSQLTQEINKRTQKSKEFAERGRNRHADNRASAGFRFTTKEMLYPIVAKSSQGSKIWDLDGNEYLDISMGFGVNLFGHNPDFIKKAIADQLELGVQLGPQSELSATVAERIAEMTGVERVAFCNSGTEGVMTAMRLARTTTKKRKIALFAGAYHGHFDGVLGAAKSLNKNPESISVIPGITHNSIDDTIVLDYGNPTSLELLEKYKDELAGILVEPVQSRRPNLQPSEFLEALRAFTSEEEIPLIFDEVITGFRIDSGGAQKHFDIKADIVVYGKIIGGGMPIGVVAGDAKYLDGLDGGRWNYSDTSYPKVETTFFAGTFCKHPLAMASSLAVLDELKEKGPALYEELNQKTAVMAARLNQYFEDQSLAIKIVYFGSLFRFYAKANIDMLFYNLLVRGIFVWEGRNFFLSTVHSEEDIEFFIAKVKESITALEPSGFLDSLKKKKSKKYRDESLEETNTELIPFSLPQEQLWILSQVDKQGWIAYNIPSNLLLKGFLELSQIEEVLHILSQRHDTLRTSIDEHTKSMKVAQRVIVPFNQIDLSHYEGEEQEEHLRLWNLEESKTPFALDGELFYRFNLIKLAEDNHILSLTVHHIFFDGWSVIVILKELAEIYTQIQQGQKISMPEAMQFKELITKRDNLNVQKKEKAEAYWMNKFESHIPTLDLPLDFKRPAMKTYSGGRFHELLDTDLINQLKKTGQQYQSTLFVTLLAAYTLLLKKISGQNRFVIGIPSSGRSMKKSETVVGYCSQLLPIESDFTREMSFADHLKQTRNLLFEGFENEDFSFAALLDKLKEKQNIMDNPLAKATFNMDPMDPFPDMGNLDVSFLPTPLSYVAYDLTLNVIELEDGFKAEWNYNVDIFKPTTIHRFSAFFKQLLAQLIKSSEQKINKISLLSAAENQKILKRSKEHLYSLPSEKSIQELFEKQVMATPDSDAIVDNDVKWSYRELNERANQWCYFLKEQGVSKGNKLALFLDKSSETIALILGVMKTGAVWISIDKGTPEVKIDHILKEVKPAKFLSNRELLGAKTIVGQETIDVDEALESVLKMSVENPAIMISPDEVAYIVYTSGSTGKPKGIRAMHSGVINYLNYLHNVLDVNNQDVVLQLAPLGFDASVRDIIGTLTAGAKLVLTKDSRDFSHLAIELEKHGITSILSAVPSLLEGLTAEVKKSKSSKFALKRILVSGEVFTTQTAKTVLNTFGEIAVYNQYGPTECTMTSTYYPVNSDDLPKLQDTLPIGKPIPNAEVYIVNEEQLMPDGITGEICIGGLGLSKGYLNQEKLTKEKFTSFSFSENQDKLYYRTGDLGRINDFGELEFFGRKDNQLKIRGFRVELSEIEAAILKYEAITACAVIPVKNKDEELELSAYISAKDKDITTNDLVIFLRKYLSEYALPGKFIELDELPLTINGKIDRKLLQDRGTELGSGSEHLMPVNELETSLLELWKEVLQKDTISTIDTFFNIGGNSLRAIQLIGRIKKKHGKLLTVADVFANQSIKKLALLLENIGVSKETEIIPITEKESYELSHAQKSLWIMDQFEENQIAYNISGKLQYLESVDFNAFEKAFKTLVQRHESLRTIFVMHGDEPRQKILSFEELGFKVKHTDLSSLSKAEKDVIIQDLEKEHPFRLNEGPLLRVNLLKIQENEFLIYCSTHHIVADGWSMNVLLNEVLTLYNAFKKNQSNPLEPLTVQFKDYVAWQNQRLQEGNLTRLKDYWERYFEGSLSLLELPYDKKRPKTPAFHGDVVDFELNNSLTASIKKLTQDHHTTLFSGLLTMVKLLLYRYSGQNDIVVGVPMAGRDRKVLENQIGFYINTTALRTRFTQNESIASLLENTGSNLAEVQQHSLYPFNLLIENLEKKGNLDNGMLFNVMIQIQDTHLGMVQGSTVEQMRNTIADTNTTISKFDLTFNFTLVDDANAILAGIEYNTDLFFRKTIEKMRDDLIFLIEQAVEDTSRSINEQELLPLKEKAVLLDDFLKPLDEF